MKIGLPYKDWGLEFDSKGFKVDEQELSESFDSIYLRMSNDKTGIIISITLEPACMEGGTNIDCRDFYWGRMKQLPIQRENIVMKEFKKMAVLEYLIPKIEGLEVGQKNLNAFMVKDDIWIDVHISKARFNEKDLKLFYSILESVKFVDSKIPKIMQLFFYAEQQFRNKNYKEAIENYNKVLELESKDHTLPKELLLVVIDNVGMAYGLSGQLEIAKGVFEQGLQIFPEYPMFYYNLACAFAEMDDLENTLSNLELCLKYKDNVIKGEQVPNPMKDSSFKRYLNNARFLDIAKKLS